jgi:hypothetical protein
VTGAEKEQQMKITRQTETRFHVIADAKGHVDGDMKLVGRELRSNEERGDLRLRTMRIKLGAKVYDAITKMAIGQSLVF